MSPPSPLLSLLLTFAAGFLAVIAGHQCAVAALNAGGILPPGFPAWSLDPVPPFGVPTVISKAFWGGLWAILIAALLKNTRGAAYWIGWTALGAIALPLVAIFAVPPLKGLPVPDFMSRFPVYALINAVWGFVTALFLRVLGKGGS